MKNIQIQNKIYYIYIVGFFLILALPLLSLPPLFHPASWGKAIIFKVIFSFLIFVFICQTLFKKHDNNFLIRIKEILNKKNRIFWPFWLLVSFLGTYLLATIFSLDPSFSFWGSPYRGGGFLNYAFLIIFAIFIFLTLRSKDWRKILDFTIFIGFLVSLVAIFQKFGLFGDFLISYSFRPISTMGSSTFLAIYITILIFLSLSFGIIAKNKKRYFYFFCFILFSFVIILTASRSALLSFLIGFLFFTLLFPNKNKFKKITYLKFLTLTLTLIILFVGMFGISGLKNQPQLVQNLVENKVFGAFFERTWSIAENLSIENIFRGRADGWKIALQGIKDRPVLGYGPENFSIAFDRYYDPTLSGISRDPNLAGSASWWDRGHNFIIDHAVNAGIPAVIIYLLLFGTLFYHLQKVKNQEQKKENKDTAIISHGIQTCFIAYFIILFLNFNVFSTYLISFLLIAYSLFLISRNDKNEEPNFDANKTQNYKKQTLWKYAVILLLFFILIWFIWFCNLKPLWINKELNEAEFLAGNNQYEKSIEKIESVLLSHSFINNYIHLQYIDIINLNIINFPEMNLELSLKAIELLEESTKLMPYHTRSYQYIGFYTNRIFEVAKIKGMEIKPEYKKELIEKANFSFKKALELSPKRSKILFDWAKFDLTLERFEQAKEKADQCLNINPDSGRCFWVKALAQINLEEIDEASKNIEMAYKNKYYIVKNIGSKKFIKELINNYLKIAIETEDIKYYEILAELYIQMVEYEPDNFQHHASLSFVYKILGEYEKAREQAMIVLELSPESKQIVEEFLKTLK